MTRTALETLDVRLQETEIKLAFLEKELTESRDALQTLHERLEALETTLEALRRAGQESDGGSLGSNGVS